MSIYDDLEKHEFDIDPKIIDLYFQGVKIKENKLKYVAHIANFEFRNFNEDTQQHLIERFGPPSKDNLFLYKDHSIEYGIDSIDNLKENCKNLGELTKSIIHRQSKTINLKIRNNDFSLLIRSLHELNRKHIIIFDLDYSNEYNIILDNFEVLKNFYNANELVYLSKNQNPKGPGEYIELRNKYNSVVDSDTKIIYVSNINRHKTFFLNNVPSKIYQEKSQFDTIITMNKAIFKSEITNYFKMCSLVVCYDLTRSNESINLDDF